jgi:hypothetical protein
MVCSDRRGEVSFYRRARVLRGSGKVDHGAAAPVVYRARRGRGAVLRFLASRLAATARVGGGWFGRLASASVAPAADQGWLLRRRRVRVVVEGVSNGVAVSR